MSLLPAPLEELEICRGYGYAKAFLFGEYAVLEGYDAIVRAFQICAFAHVGESCAGYSDYESRVCRELGASFVFDSKAFFDQDQTKLGLGSSAAIVVAASHALIQRSREHVELLNNARPCSPLMEAIALHKKLQNGLGSGADVIASALGGVVNVRSCPDDPQVTRMDPHCPPHIFLISNQGAPTASMIEKTSLNKKNNEYLGICRELGSISKDAIECFKFRDFRSTMELALRVDPLLERLEKILGKRIITDRHRCLSQAARANGFAAKVSGAGGGDLSLVFGENWEALELFAKGKAREIGFSLFSQKSAPQRDFWN